jgi:hypothetical protein
MLVCQFRHVPGVQNNNERRNYTPDRCSQYAFQFAFHSSSVNKMQISFVVSRRQSPMIQALYAARDRSFGRDTAIGLFCIFSNNITFKKSQQ